MRFLFFISTLSFLLTGSSAFLSNNKQSTTYNGIGRTQISYYASTLDSAQLEKTTQAVDKLKRVLNREYVSFFDPMQREYYSDGVSFDDPMTSLSGVDAYQNNVDMLASRTLMGKFLFQDGGIVLHSVTGGEVQPDGRISDIITRWTLRVTVKVLPWQPTARFSGISVYEVSPGGSEGVVVDHQTDYWDSINIQQGGDYAKVDKGIAIKDFLNQLKPENGNAAAAGVEMPYQLLRRGKDYEVRRYPAYNAATIPYDRRDEGYDLLATITKGIEPLTPAIMQVPNDNSQKTMSWPLNFAPPGSSSPPPIPKSVAETAQQPMWKDCHVGAIPSKVIAVGSFADASVAPVVRKADARLREALKRDGITVSDDSDSVKFAQYDAIFTLGKRRGEVWIELEDGAHPWSE
ncbi:SOUL heme-binding domain containing protein [Nitzschia inconspicua]|uniref:SOUL heme-binding domain containing protein n=1 Tax=Nitzschia inconspicua TaxID=303405 RepID=A0A9K3KMT4_9STRA|nr:SOUL heme-binding domain containing protein [Nitzschia inconspicua]